MLIRRRENLLLMAAGGLAATHPVFAAVAARPVFWQVQDKSAKVYILGFSEAKDRSWLTPAIEKAFNESGEIWFETPQPDPSAPPPPKPAAAPTSAQPPGYAERNLFEVLNPELSARMLAASQKYGVPREKLEHTKPWRAYFVLNGGYFAKKGAGAMDIENFPDVVLSRMAYAARKTVQSEFATGADAMAHFINMPDEEASERLEFLLDFLDDDEAGRMSDRYDWILGHNNNRAIDRMRTKWPALYQDEQVNRNVGWAKRISTFLANGGIYFVVIGLQHTLGPDSLPKQLRDLGLKPQVI
jgi:uncharacterized protein YbaP (TraB family)